MINFDGDILTCGQHFFVDRPHGFILRTANALHDVVTKVQILAIIIYYLVFKFHDC